MRSDVAQNLSLDRKRAVTVTLHPSDTFADVIVRDTTDDVDLTPFVAKGSVTHNGAKLTLRWHDSTFLVSQPKPGHIVSLTEDGDTLFTGVIASISSYRESRGNRSMSLVIRARDSVGPWRGQRVSSARFGLATQLHAIAEDVIASLGLSDSEYLVPQMGLFVPHVSTQFSNETPWNILEMVYLAAGYTPFTDVLGRINYFNRDITRPADIVLTSEQVLSIGGSKQQQTISVARVKWLNPELTEVVQLDQSLASETIMAGFFRLKQEREVQWSSDRRQRAKNTYMKVLQSVNDGLLPVGDEEYEQLSDTTGEITVKTSAWVPALATGSLVAMLALDWLPDGVVTAGFVANAGETIPWGRAARGAAEAALILTMMSLGSGSYEIWGQPYDFVHQRNTTDAYNDATPYWASKIEEIENDLISSESHSQQVAIRELLYRTAAASTWGVETVDDIRIEVGDILELPDASRLFVLGYTRDITRGSPAVLKIEGFRV